MEETIKACIIGPGNLGTHLYRWLLNSDVEVIQVFSRQKDHPSIPTSLIISDIKQLTRKADIYFLCLRDMDIDIFLQKSGEFPGLWVHCSGTLDMSIFEGKRSRFGVFYPLQTFSRDIPMEYGNIPLLLESCKQEDMLLLRRLAELMSTHVDLCTSSQRKEIHLAAVFASNFLNHMLTAADDIISSEGISFSLLKELIMQTVNKAIQANPKASQTGPAIRGDKAVIQDHLDRLHNKDRWERLYKVITKSIQETHSVNNGDTD